MLWALAWMILGGTEWGHAQSTPLALPAHAYLYLEPYQLRVEVLIHMPEMLEELGQPIPNDLSPEQQKSLTEAAAKKVEPWLSLSLDGAALSHPPLSSASAVKGVPGRTEPVGPKDHVAPADSMVGFVWEVPMPNVPKTLQLTWQGFDTRIASLPGAIFAGQASQEFELSAASPAFNWQSHGEINLRKPLVAVPPPPAVPIIGISLAALAALLVGGVLVLKTTRPATSSRWAAALGVLAVAAFLWVMQVLSVSIKSPITPKVETTKKQAQDILGALLRNTYRAFDQTTESGIYDVLARSISGDLLQKIYLQTIGALTLDGQDGTRVRVNDFSITIDQVIPLPDKRGFEATGQWNALGTVGHWGHVHMRMNQYKARITVEPVDGAWKMTALQVLEERRI